jgi:hypothetical protein
VLEALLATVLNGTKWHYTPPQNGTDWNSIAVTGTK